MNAAKSTLQILTVQEGDKKLVIETEKDAEDANKLIADLSRQGYLITTEAGEKVTGVTTMGIFIIKDGPKPEETKEAEPGTKATATAPVAGG